MLVHILHKALLLHKCKTFLQCNEVKRCLDYFVYFHCLCYDIVHHLCSYAKKRKKNECVYTIYNEKFDVKINGFEHTSLMIYGFLIINHTSLKITGEIKTVLFTVMK